MNNLDILIEKLRTFPKNELCKFYCPINNTYYYVSKRSLCHNPRTLYFELTPHEQFHYLSYEEVIELMLKYGSIGYVVVLQRYKTEFKFQLL
jgi:hypothetical protein